MKKRMDVGMDVPIGKMKDGVTHKNLKKVLNRLATVFDDELSSRSQEQLEEYWHFKFDPKGSLETNMYEFHKMLELYRSFCRRWEEKHNGSCCVVERVRDKYLMPKIREFAKDIKDSFEQGVRL